MPVVCEFFGIKILMYWNERTPPQFHAQFGEFEAQISIKAGAVIRGALPIRQLKLVLAWCELHREELQKNWESGKKKQEFSRIHLRRFAQLLMSR